MSENPSVELAPRVIPRSEHNITRKNINESAIKVLYRLHQAGYQAYLVGGGVRDLLLHLEPKDFDVATDATPEQIKALFSNCRIIGRRFRLAHIHFGREIVEVATFRGHHQQADDDARAAMTKDGMIIRDNVYGTLAEDAWRRDFTVNALYYNIADFSVVDYTGGYTALQARRLSMIGDAGVRCQEDPVRILRAIRFAAKLDFTLDTALLDAIAEQKHRIEAVPPARLFDEVLKLFLGGYALKTYRLLREYGLLEMLFPATHKCLTTNANDIDKMIEQGCMNTDLRIQQGKPVTPAFLFAFLLWGPIKTRAHEFEQNGMSPIQSLQEAGRAILHQQAAFIAIPKRFRLPIRDIWTGQARLRNRRWRRASWMLEQTRFRAVYDFLLLRYESGEQSLQELSDWWTRFQSLNEKERRAMCQELQRIRQGQKPRKPKKKA